MSKHHLKDEGSRFQTVTSGAISGLVARFVISPLDVVKIRLQLQSSAPSEMAGGGKSLSHTGTISTLRRILVTEGLTALWKGNIPAEIMYVCYSAVQFTTYRSVTQLQHHVFGKGTIPDVVETFISGATAGATATITSYPLDLLRTRFAAQGNHRVYGSLSHAIRDIKRDEGYRGFFRGLSPTVSQIIPYMGIFFAAYEALRLPLTDLHMPWGSGDATAGVAASILAKTAVFPLDLVRKRIQVQGPTRGRYVYNNIPIYNGAVHALATIARTEGLRGLYRGLLISLAKSAPSSAVTVWTYERTLHALIRLEKSQKDNYDNIL